MKVIIVFFSFLSRTLNSQNFEESPISDGKMDISDTTTASQDSPVISPDDDHINQPNESLLQSNSKTNQNSYISTETKTNTTNTTTMTTVMPPRKMTPIKPKKTASTNYDSSETTTLLDTAEHYQDNLDNRKICCLKDDNDDADDISAVNNSNGATYNHSISTRGLTLANSHPLMSPPAAPSYDDSDSDHDHQNIRPVHNSATSFNYPDVVPESEPLRLAQPRLQLHSSTKEVTTRKSTIDVVRPVVEKITPAASISDYLNSDDDESEPDISQYQATVTPLFQSVALVSNREAASTANSDTTKIGQRKIAATSDFLSDVSSFDSISNRSFDDDAENNLVSASVSSSVFDDTGFNQGPAASSGGGPGNGDNDELATPAGCGDDAELPFDVPIPQYTASEEARDSRNWQKITLPDGRTRDIDMKVIEPYKRVLSHGGYLSSGGHNAIVVFSACYLPDRSRTDYHYVMDNLFL